MTESTFCCWLFGKAQELGIAGRYHISGASRGGGALQGDDLRLGEHLGESSRALWAHVVVVEAAQSSQASQGGVTQACTTASQRWDSGPYRAVRGGALESGDGRLRQHLGKLDHSGHVLAVVGDVVVGEAASTSGRPGRAAKSEQGGIVGAIILSEWQRT